MSKLWIFSLMLCLGAAAHAADMAGFSTEEIEHCYPKGEHRPERMGFQATGISKEQFDQVLARVAEVYQPIFRQKGLQLDVVPLWDNPQPNAGAMPHPQDPMRRGILMFGGLARHPEMTADGFALVACHEVGHHIGGAPHSSRRTWRASNEGQSDYFAALKCARKIFDPQESLAMLQGQEVPTLALQKCSSVFEDEGEVAVCVRTAIAGKALSNALRSMLQESVTRRFPERQIVVPTPLFRTPDERQVSVTSNAHPEPQCRLDTMFQGAICHADVSIDVSFADQEQGACMRRLGDRDGVRPLCWFSPRSATPAAPSSQPIRLTQNSHQK